MANRTLYTKIKRSQNGQRKIIYTKRIVQPKKINMIWFYTTIIFLIGYAVVIGFAIWAKRDAEKRFKQWPLTGKESRRTR